MLSRKYKIREFIAVEIARDIHPADLPYDYDLIETGIVDSLSLVRLISWLGENFDVPVNEVIMNASDFSTVDQIDAFVEGHVLVEA